MTTIGYGDRSPGNEPEIVFTMCAELVGLVFFVLLLDRITTVYVELKRDHTAKSAVKDEIVQFLSQTVPGDHQGTSGLSEKKSALIKKVVKFLQFKNSAQTCSRMIDPNGVFSNLSEALQEETTAAVFVPLLQELRLFGHCTADEHDRQDVERLFNEVLLPLCCCRECMQGSVNLAYVIGCLHQADPDGSGELNDEEIRSLILDHFKVDLTEDELREAIDLMDISRTKSDRIDSSTPSSRQEAASITLDEFEHWWYLQKHGRPRLMPCPDEILRYYALRLQAECSSPGDLIVRKGEYGDRLYMLLQGTVHVRDLEVASNIQSMLTGTALQNNHLLKMSTNGLLLSIAASDNSDHLFGLIGTLNEGDCTAEYECIRSNTCKVVVSAAPEQHNFCEIMSISQEDFLIGLTHESFAVRWERTEPGSAEPEPILSFMQEYARNQYYKYYHPDGHYW